LGAEHSVYFQNLPQELFGTTKSGSVWLDSAKPLMFETRTYNQTSGGTFGQHLDAVARRRVLGKGEGKLYLIGLREDTSFRTNILIQEVTGTDTVATIEIFNPDGSSVTRRRVDVSGHSRVSKNLNDLGVNNLESCYAAVDIRSGGKIAVLGSLVDGITGDATTKDAVHPLQVLTSAKKRCSVFKDIDNLDHLLVAVVARALGENNSLWRSSVSIHNPSQSSQNITLEYYPWSGEKLETTLELESGKLFVSNDFLGDNFPEAGDGAGSLHIRSSDGVIVDSRIYNLLASGGTMGQTLPGLDLESVAQPEQVWILNNLKQNENFRCNLGFTEYSGFKAEVRVLLFDLSGNSRRYLAAKTYTIPAFKNLQISRVFSDMKIDGNYNQGMAYVVVTSEKGAVYVYASNVDNLSGDAETIIAKKR